MKNTVWVLIMAILSVIPMVKDTKYVARQKLILEHPALNDVLTIGEFSKSPIQC